MSRGVYVALEGVEGSGKSTVATLLQTLLAADGLDVGIVREPGGTDLGEELRRLLLHSGDVDAWAEAAMFAASRAQLAREVVAPALARGRWIISDRTYYSSLAYQGAGRGLGIDTVRSLNETVLAGVLPDVVFVLDIHPEVGFAREVERDRMGDAGIALQMRVAEAYRSIAAGDPKVHLVDADQPPDVTASQLRVIIREVEHAS